MRLQGKVIKGATYRGIGETPIFVLSNYKERTRI